VKKKWDRIPTFHNFLVDRTRGTMINAFTKAVGDFSKKGGKT